MAADRLAPYRAKRDFSKTGEPSGAGPRPAGSSRARRTAKRGLRFLVQKHAASRLHYDLRLEHGGVLLSWAVTRGPSLDPADKRLAVHVEDHPLAYGDFEGTIPRGEYGGGTVMLWDEGTWEPVNDAEAGLAKGDFKFNLFGERLRGRFVLVRMKPKRGEKPTAENWLLIKERDAFVEVGEPPVTDRFDRSVRSGRSMEEIAAGDREWIRSGERRTSPKTSAPSQLSGAVVILGGGAPGGKAGAPSARQKAGAEPPGFVAPQLAGAAAAPPEGDGWLHELKYDGYRALAAIGGGTVRLYTRTGLDWTDRFAPLRAPLAALPVHSALLDGEVAVADSEGRTDFGALQQALAEGGRGIAYYVFDLLSLDGQDLRRHPLVERKARLAKLLGRGKAPGALVYSDHVAGHGAAMFAEAKRLGLEGIVSKEASSPYRSGRSTSWLKSKTGLGQEFVVLGWEPSEVRGRAFASLLLGTREGGGYRYRGKVGSGFDGETLNRVGALLAGREVAKPAAKDIPPEFRRTARFVRPDLVAEIAHRGITRDNYVRQASFKGLREDKPAREVVDESAGTAVETGAKRPAKRRGRSERGA